MIRKELTVYVNTMEKEEFSVYSVAANRDFVIINVGGGKFTANIEQLREALIALEVFNKENNKEIQEVESIPRFTIEYGEKDEQ